MNFETWFGERHSDIPFRSAEAVLKLISEGATLPFIARYRKEQTGNLDEVKIQAVIDGHEKWEVILHRQKHIVEEIERQKKLTPELKDKILSTFQIELLDDLYLPYKIKRKTKAAMAKEAGLEPLADWIWNCANGTETPLPGQTLEIWAFTFRNEKAEIKDAETAISGAQDILVERISEIQDLRQLVRVATFGQAVIKTGKGPKAKPHSKFENYFTYHEPIESLMQPQNSHRYLALRRGWLEEELSLNIGGVPDEQGGDGGFEEGFLKAFENAASANTESPGAAILKKAARLSLKAHVQPSIENEVHKSLREVADQIAIRVFSENVRKLLLASPFGPKAVLGVDPGIRTGCKLAVVDDSGKYIASTVMYLQSESEKKKSAALLSEVIGNAKIRAIAVGNGTAGRETETFIRKTLKEASVSDVPVVMVNEAGASVYSASEAAREEFPELDVTVRGAISIARRLQDPLAELVKIDPKSIGVGQYQHDVAETALKRSLEVVVDSCVNQVGVNLNTASYHLLSHVAGIGPSLAKAVVEHRGQKGIFQSREALLEVPRFSKKTFEQAAGFLKIPESANPLDNTGVHPERYEVLQNHAQKLGKKIEDLIGKGVEALRKDQEFKKEVGDFTFQDILSELEKPGRDIREEFVPFQYREDILEVKDLVSGMLCPGIVTNVTNFGAFVDIGVHQDGLVHLSQLANQYVKDPREVVNPGDRVQVRVLEVNLNKNQISLSMKTGNEARQEARARATGDGTLEKKKRERGGKRGSRAKPDNAPKPSTDPNAPKIEALSAERPAIKPGLRPSGNMNGPRPSPTPSPGGFQGGPSAKRPPAPKQAFNNAFAGLAGLKDQLKAKK